MRSILLLAATMAILYIVTSSAVATSTSTSSEYDDYNDDYEESSTTTNKSSPKTSSTEYYEEEESNSSSNNEYEDEESEYEEEEDSSASTSSHKQPYNCPSQCKCRFKRRSGQSSEYDDEEDYDYEKESVKLKRVRREVGKNKTSDEYLYDYEDHSTSKKSRTHHVKYDITVDCSAQGLFTIADLFDYDFPLDQIVSFNLSSNKFRLLRLDDGFEDLLNLKELDISSNPYLKSISPRNFLKKFRFLEKIHLNNLPQINCQENEKTGRIVSIDCKWYRTLLYLHKRNISIDFHYFNRFSHQSGSVNDQSTPKCTLGSLINNQANNIALISRCLTDFDSSDRPSSGSNRVKGTSNQTKIYNIDNVQYEFRIEPDLSQLLIEGDSLELTCRLIKKSSLAKKQPPFNSQIKWYLNEKQQLMISSIFYNNENPTQIEIFESKLKRQQHSPPRTNTEETVIESKLLITNTMSSQHTGKYSCSAIIEDSSGVKRTPISTSRVDIKVLGRQQLDANGVASNQAQVTKTMSTKMPTTTPMAYCDEMIVQTYRGVYKWPRTLANSKLSQKCVFTAATANGGPNKANETSNVVAIECLADGRWSDQIDTRNCMFESNLTRYLARFAENKDEVISRPDLDEFIHKIVSIQSEPKSRLGGGVVSSNPSPVQITTYDIIYIESFLLTALQHLKFVSTDQSKSSWRHKFIWLSDMLGRLNEFYIRRAQSIHPNTFSSFFFEALLPVALTNTNNDLSTTLASSRLSRLTNTACCVLRRVQLTQQLEFICNAACRPIIDPSNNLPKLTQVQAVFSQLNSSLEFVVFENDRLIPVNLNLSTRNYDILTFAKPSTTTALNGHRVNRTCSQIVALRGRSVERVDLTIEIDLPRAYSRLLKLIYTQLANVSAANSERSSVDRNLFEYIFQSDRADFLRDESDVDEDDLPVMIISNGEWSTIAGSIEVDSNGAERGAAAVRRDERLVKSELRMARFRDELVNKWLNPLSYEVVYGLERNFTRSDDSNRTYRLIDWATSMDGFRCTLINVHINWQPNSSIQFTDLFRTYAVLSCNQTSTSQSSDKLTMIGVRHRSEINTTSSKSNLKNVAIAQLFEKYSSAFKLDLDSSANNLGPIDRFLHSMRLKYRLFEHRLVYAASALVSILLVANILLYSTLHASLQMPRSFYHVFVNKWLAIAGLNAIYAIGSAQIHLPHLCFFTAAASHYLLLASFAWYAIFFYVLYKKLAVLKRRNAVLIFNPELANKIDREPEDEEDDECHGLDGKNQGFIKRPVIHLYMIAWGLPLALCSIIISITRQDYIQTPYSYCFTNEPNILVGSVMLPIVFVFAAQFVIVMLILRTLRRIMIDLKHDELINGPQDDADDYEDEVKVSPGLATDRVDDRQELCKNWLNSKTAKDQQGTYNGTRVGSHADNLAATDMIEIKMNPITQKSLVINHSAYTTALGGAAEDSSTSFERESSLDSDRTSVMDTQYKPHVQLKFAFISWLVYFVLCALAASLTLVSTSPSPDPFLLRLFSFFFVVFAAAYAIMQFVFYSLSRDDVCGQFGICSVSLFGGKKVEMADNVDEYDDTKKCPDEVDNRADYETKSDVIEGVEKWSYEPKVIVPTPTLRENNAPVSLLPNVVANNPSSPPKITLDDCIYEKYQFRSIAEKDKTQTETLIVTTTTLATSTSATKEGGFESLSMSKKVSQNEEKRGLEEDTSAEEEIISDDDDHKKSISDVLFSAAKKTSPTTTASQKTKHDSPKQALNYKESPSNHPTSERNEMSTSSPLITSSGVEIDEEDVTESDETSTHSYADSNVNHVILNAPYQLEQQQHHKIVNHCPTLAVQEDMSDYITLTPQPAEQQHHQSIAKTPASLSVPKRSNHVRNPSLLSGATAQTIQLITGSNFINDSETRDRKQQQPQSQPQQPSKRPLYVYVDHSYEEKLQTETTTSTTTTRKEANTIEPRSKRTNSRKNLLNDLLTNTCTSHIGNAIDSIVPAASSSTSSTSSQHNHQTTKLVQSKSMTIGTSNSSATTTRTSSMVSSSSTNEHLDVDEETQPMQIPPQPKYRQSSVARLVANNAAHTTKTLPHSHVTARLDSTAAARLSASLLDTPPTNTTATNVKNNLIQRPPRLRDFEPKHETSV